MFPYTLKAKRLSPGEAEALTTRLSPRAFFFGLVEKIKAPSRPRSDGGYAGFLPLKGGKPKLKTTKDASFLAFVRPLETPVYFPDVYQLPPPIAGAPALTRRGSDHLEPPLKQ
ncbi:jg4905 [Pararge aegeria aegeria]|uniref:Jg4905 protein n=1 Tax=Pararge aegeria aegeria TaxID=348720 RepID=A0A8S4QQ76_9NEOP|nr:jg4905 [Pararge aegeria aegeria]